MYISYWHNINQTFFLYLIEREVVYIDKIYVTKESIFRTNLTLVDKNQKKDREGKRIFKIHIYWLTTTYCVDFGLDCSCFLIFIVEFASHTSNRWILFVILKLSLLREDFHKSKWSFYNVSIEIRLAYYLK